MQSMEVPQTPLHTSRVLKEEKDTWEDVKVSHTLLFKPLYLQNSTNLSRRFCLVGDLFRKMTWSTCFFSSHLHDAKFSILERQNNVADVIRKFPVFSIMHRFYNSLDQSIFSGPVSHVLCLEICHWTLLKWTISLWSRRRAFSDWIIICGKSFHVGKRYAL